MTGTLTLTVWSRHLQLGNLKAVDDSLPFDSRFLEIDEKTQGSSRSPQIVETLRGVFAGETLGTFQFDDQHIFDEEIRKIFSHRMALVSYCKRNFGGGA